MKRSCIFVNIVISLISDIPRCHLKPLPLPFPLLIYSFSSPTRDIEPIKTALSHNTHVSLRKDNSHPSTSTSPPPQYNKSPTPAACSVSQIRHPSQHQDRFCHQDKPAASCRTISMTTLQSEADVPPPPSLANVLDTTAMANLSATHIPYLTPLLHLLSAPTPTHILDMAQRTTLFFGILFTMEAAQPTSASKSTGCSFIVYLTGGVLNGLVMDFLERKLGIRKGSGAPFTVQLVVAVVISGGMLEVVGGGL